MSSIYNYVYDKFNYVAEIRGYLQRTHLWQVNYVSEISSVCQEQRQDTQFKDKSVYDTGTFVEVISSPWKSEVCADDICGTAKMSETQLRATSLYITRQQHTQNIQIMFDEVICQQHIPVLTGKVTMLNFI
jgi:hypothetical protein